ncbi:MAG: hypothetical protein A2729_06125 [Candidatus Buchananbacteria bacterium RIFCSPHIGHO2_01_FULL_39_14]|uniref:Uncharacterized protein n=2 Tax=Candidatus Buchananiibacteriota TaxID=1817903 RepID=A0A1G1YNX3_9BACT|nr:MAG: hypothetical protein A2729_06125 [Candidatus Buchananbacteria bacterium RIFCSPHIGHO2_01_FULL_39_14]OGY49354.1 MAG: hypothetical protein A3D39_04235 [Candidatus Buchananbacteria bacterium RIFCSPHIGHO2_02_FULL_39_17]OGY53350.1 MAG: hypothetical protein A2912_05295 [Candidatus Buchananbacteria bacterium RIFCSPLOWO2_01_FULL_40_23b]
MEETNRRFLFFVVFFSLFFNLTFSVWAQKPKALADFSKTFSEKLAEQIWPNLWFELQRPTDPFRDEKFLATKAWEETRKRTQSVIGNAAKDAFGEESKKSPTYHRFRQQFENLDLKIAVYYSQPGGRETEEKLTLETSRQIAEVKRLNQKEQRTTVDLGLRFRTNPALYLRYQWLNNHNGQKLIHDWSWYPASNSFEYTIHNFIGELDCRLKYDYEHELIKFRLQDFPLSRNAFCSFSTSYGFSDDDFRVQIGIYGRF